MKTHENPHFQWIQTSLSLHVPTKKCHFPLGFPMVFPFFPGFSHFSPGFSHGFPTRSPLGPYGSQGTAVALQLRSETRGAQGTQQLEGQGLASKGSGC